MCSISIDQLHQIHEIWHSIKLLRSDQIDEAMKLLLKHVGQLLDCQRATWVGATRNKNRQAIPVSKLLDEWYALDFFSIELNDLTVDIKQRAEHYYKLKQQYGLDEITQASIRSNGSNRVLLRKDVMDDDQWNQHWLTTEYYKDDFKIGDIMHVVINVDTDCESYFALYRDQHQPDFNEIDKALALTAISGISHLHHQILAFRGAALPSDALLSAQEQNILKQLSQGQREKEIAADLGISLSTIKKHTASIYRKYNVQGKFELMSILFGS